MTQSSYDKMVEEAMEEHQYVQTSTQNNSLPSANSVSQITSTGAGTMSIGGYTIYTPGSGYTVSGASGQTITIGAGGGGSMSYGVGYTGSTSGVYSYNYTIPVSKVNMNYSEGSIECEKLIVNGADVTNLMSTICDRLAIIEHADPAQLEKYSALKIAYEKYKFLEKMLNDKEGK